MKINARIPVLAGILVALASACLADPEADSGQSTEQSAASGGVSAPEKKPIPNAGPGSSALEIKEWLVPYENTRPRDPFVDSAGRVWFCGQGGAYLAYLIPATGEFKKFDLADGAGPHNLIIDDDDFVWYAANTLPYIGKMNPDTGAIQKFAMPEPVKDPHTLVFDSAGDIWFTAQRSNVVGKLNTKTGEVKYVAAPVNAARPYGIKIDASDRPWVVLFGTNKLATVDAKTMQMTSFDLPRPGARLRRLEITGDGRIWYVDYAQGMLGRFDPTTKGFSEWPLPGGSKSRPYGTALDDKGVVWMAEGGTPNRLVGFNTATEEFVGVDDVPNSAGAIRHMYFDPAAREIWFGEDSNYIGRARVP